MAHTAIAAVHFCKELAGCCPDTNIVDVTNLEVMCSSSKGGGRRERDG